jgi:uncharacterized protein (DUF4213/DUF364 family)
MNHKEIADIILKAIDNIPDREVTCITYGSHIVSVESSKTGLATWAWHGSHPVPLNDLPDPKTGCLHSVKQLAQLIHDNNPLKASLGLAALNSVLPDIDPENITDINASDLILKIGKGKKVAIVGHFPFVRKIREEFDDLMVFEKQPRTGDLESVLIPEKIPLADIVALTATTISNKTLASILSSCSENAVKLIIGPSTPLCTAMFDIGFDYVAGSIVKNKKIVKQGITQGVPFKQLKGVQHVIIKKN